MAGDFGAFVFVVDLGQWVEAVVDAECDAAEPHGVGRAFAVLRPAGKRALALQRANQIDIFIGRDVANRHADAQVAQIAACMRWHDACASQDRHDGRCEDAERHRRQSLALVPSRAERLALSFQ